MKTVLVTGASGFLGWHLADRLSEEKRVIGTYLSHPVLPQNVEGIRLDLRDRSTTLRTTEQIRPQIIFHCAALSKPELCEQEKKLAEEINVSGTELIVRAARSVDAKLIYISTDLVFDGQKGNYSEKDTLGPINFYAKTKLHAEQIVFAGNYTIVRVTLMYGNGNGINSSFSDWILRNLREGKIVNLFTDEYRTPVYVKDAAEALALIAKSGSSGELYHLGGSERLTRYEFGRKLADVFGYNHDLIKPMRIEEFEFLAKRARDCSLCSIKLKRKLGFEARGIIDTFREMRSLISDSSMT